MGYLQTGLLRSGFDMGAALRKVREIGYATFHNAISPPWLVALQDEINSLDLEVGDHVTHPINAGRPREVRQLHARAYFAVNDPKVPVSLDVACALRDFVKPFWEQYPCLEEWICTEAGYQRYRDSSDWISPHRDRRNDQLLSATITIRGSAHVRWYETIDNPNNYAIGNLREIDSFECNVGTLLLLRAPGFGGGKQVIHQVMGPHDAPRDILNLRRRMDVLPDPAAFLAKYASSE